MTETTLSLTEDETRLIQLIRRGTQHHTRYRVLIEVYGRNFSYGEIVPRRPPRLGELSSNGDTNEST